MPASRHTLQPGKKVKPVKLKVLEFEKRGSGRNEAMVFIHGWPDDRSLWDREFEHFSRSRCCVRFTLPNCGTRLDLERGADFPELVELISRTIAQALPDHRQVILVGHDWGAYLAYLYERSYPERVSRMVTMDVGGHFRVDSLAHGLMIAGYQWWLTAAWLTGMVLPFAGNWMTRVFARYAGAPRGGAVHSRMNYFYFYLWRAILCPKKYGSSLPGRYRPRCPVLYFYAVNKPFQFHSARWEKLVSASPGSKLVAVTDAGHWLMRDQHERVAGDMERWLGQGAHRRRE